ncbi:hypothetical protein V6N13_121092 [Hibiscus sabdariffa]
MDGPSSEAESTTGAFIGLVNGTEVIHGFTKFFLVSYGGERVGTLVLRKRPRPEAGKIQIELKLLHTELLLLVLISSA